MKHLLIVREGATEREVPVLHTVVVGRDADCTVCLNDPRLSRKHAEFVVAGAAVTVRDLKSRNGIEINGVRTDTAVLRPGDVVGLAEVSITYAPVSDDIAPHGDGLVLDDRTVYGSPAMAGVLAKAAAPAPAVAPVLAPAPSTPVHDEDATRVGSIDDIRSELGALPVAARAAGGMAGAPSPTADVAEPVEPAPRQSRFTWADHVMLRAAALAVLVGGIALAMAWLAQRSLLTSQGEARATVLVGWLAAEGATADGPTLDAAVQALGKEPGVVSALIVSTDGRILAPTQRMSEPLGRLPGLDLSPADVVRLRVVEQNGRLELVKPVRGGRAIAWLTYNANEAGGGLSLAMGLTFIVGAAGTFLVAGAIRRVTFAGLTRFREDVELVMSGQLTRVADTLGARPLEELASVVNYLVTRTKASGGLAPVSFDGKATPEAAPQVVRDAWIITDASFKVTEASASIAVLLGVRVDTMVGRHLLDAVPDKQVSEAILKCLSGVSLHGRDETVIGGSAGTDIGSYVVTVVRKGKHDPITIRFTRRRTGGQA